MTSRAIAVGGRAMYVCICNAVTERDIAAAANRGVTTLEELRMATGCASTCGTCACFAEDILETHRREAAAADTQQPGLVVAPA